MRQLSDLRHDLRRNLSAINAGFEIINGRKPDDLRNIQQIIKEMNIQCKNTLELLEELFASYEIKEKKGKDI